MIDQKILDAARKVRSRTTGNSPARVLLTEGDDNRVLEAAIHLNEKGIAKPIILTQLDSKDIPAGIEAIDPLKHEKLELFTEQYLELRRGKGEDADSIKTLITSPLFFGAMYLRNGLCDAAVSGAVHTTADVFRAGIRCLGVAPGITTASSFFLMLLADGRPVTFADCALLPYPSSEELADIAISAAANHNRLTGETPRVALLSFSTKGSASHERVEHVVKALELIKERNPNLIVDGELQFDAAFVPKVAERKAPNSVIKGDANVFIFPNLDAGNLAYKITERVGGARALGPFLQGLSKPWMDLSRGCNSDDIVLTAAIALILSQQ